MAARGCAAWWPEENLNIAPLISGAQLLSLTIPSYDEAARTATDVADAVLALTGLLAGLLLLMAASLWLFLAVSRVGRPRRERLPWVQSRGGTDLE